MAEARAPYYAYRVPGFHRKGGTRGARSVLPESGYVKSSAYTACPRYRYEDVTSRVAELDQAVPLEEEYAGPATIVGYTVVFNRENPSHAIAICDIPGGKRTVVRSDDAALIESMTREEFCGRVVEVVSDGSFSVPSGSSNPA